MSKEYEAAFPYMKNWRIIWAIEETGDKKTGDYLREHLSHFGFLPSVIKEIQ